MADFTRARKFVTKVPILKVDGGLPVGIHTFQLVVADAGGNQSRAVRLKVKVVNARIPTPPVLDGGGISVIDPILTPIRRP